MPKLHAGLDVGHVTTAICVITQDGDILLEAVADTTPQSISSHLKPFRKHLLNVGQEPGTKSAWLHRELVRLKYPMRSMDPYHAHSLLGTRLNKTDRNDAQGLALLLAKDLYRPAHVKSEEAVRLSAMLSLRDIVVRKANDLDLAIEMMKRRLGPQPLQKSRRRAMAMSDTQAALTMALQKIVESAAEMRATYSEIDKLVARLAKEDALCQRLMTVPGVGPITALNFVATIDDPYRFKSSRTVAAYLGLTPRVFQSGVSSRSGGISHRGSHSTRKALFMAGRALLTRSRCDCALRRWGLRLAKAKGNKTAYVACARKIAVLLHHLWISGQEFDPSK